MSDLRSAVGSVFAADGALSRVMDGYEPREGQRRMADAVATVLESGGTLLAEAGTGTGKTLAYLIPGILSGHRMLVSTGTKNLQEQIFFKDLPALQRALGVRFTATLMKGRSNYLCLQRWETFRDETDERPERPELFERSERSERHVFVPLITAWLKQTKTGDRSELRDLPEDLPLWKDVAADSETCLGVECPRYNDCFVTQMRQRAAEADVVIVNHHLLCADASVRTSAFGEVIPSCPTLVVDEAHQLEDVATQYFGRAVSNFRIEDLVRDVERVAGRRLLGHRNEEILRGITRVSERTRLFFGGISLSVEFGLRQIRYAAESLGDQSEAGMMLVGALEGLEAVLALARQPHDALAGEDTEAEADLTELLSSLSRRAGELRSDLRFLLRAEDADYVYYLEARGRGIYLRASPVDVSRVVQDALFDRMRAVVLTSATLAVDGSFRYVKNRLGIRTALEVCVPSEFDYARQALLYLPRRMPPPKSPAFADAVAREVAEILHRTRGRAFVLFTSYAVLRAVQQVLEASLPYPILTQGHSPRSILLDQFRSTPNAVLLATSSFWQGVDVVGEALSCVIIDKLPFASPADPIVAARIETANAAGGDAFADYQVPLAMLALHQGLGRLIRHRSDRGVLAILDPRLRTMSYGARFLAGLPPAPVTHDLDAVLRFFM
jgi:ATP-dependent DNA helicase DinG